MMKRSFLLMSVLLVWIGGAGFVSEDGQVYSMACEFARVGRQEFAFMHYNHILREYPQSSYREQALFAAGEFYFNVFSYKEATSAFQKFIDEYPDAEERIYALAYMLNLAEREQDIEAVKGLEKKIVALQQVSLVFRKTKEASYLSPLHQHYQAVIHIDKMEFYVEGDLFAQVSY